MLLSRTPFRAISQRLHQTIRCLSDKVDQKDEANSKIVRMFEDKEVRGKMTKIDSILKDDTVPEHVDVLIVGGGVVGSSIAYHLKNREANLRIAVIERDNTYERASTPRSNGGCRQQFELEENIRIALYGSEFLKNAAKHLSEEVNVNFLEYGYLFLVTEDGAEKLEQNSKFQNSLGAKNVILTPNKLKERFPWLNTDQVALGKDFDLFFIIIEKNY